MLRAVSYLTALIVLTFWYGMRTIIAAAFRVPNRTGGVYDRCNRGWARGLLRAAGVTVSTVGMEKVPRDRPVVYASNHQSFFDILAYAATIPGTMRFVSKIELSRVPILGPAMRASGHIFIDRFNRQRALGAYEETAKVVRAGLSAVVFPEGTRSRTGELLPFKKGPFVFAIAAQVPVVPAYCAGTFDILPKGSIRVHPKPVTLCFGEPIETTGMDYEDREALMQRTRAAVERLRTDSSTHQR